MHEIELKRAEIFRLLSQLVNLLNLRRIGQAKPQEEKVIKTKILNFWQIALKGFENDQRRQAGLIMFGKSFNEALEWEIYFLSIKPAWQRLQDIKLEKICQQKADDKSSIDKTLIKSFSFVVGKLWQVIVTDKD